MCGGAVSDRWLIFDFDGVIADSEVLANLVLAEIVTALGVATTLEDSYRLFMGKRFPMSSLPSKRPLGENCRPHLPQWSRIIIAKCSASAVLNNQGSRLHIAPLIIRWGADSDNDNLRKLAKCSKCGHRGATLQTPGGRTNTAPSMPQFSRSGPANELQCSHL